MPDPAPGAPSTETATPSPTSPYFALINGTDLSTPSWNAPANPPVQIIETPEEWCTDEPGELLFKITGLAESSADGTRSYFVQVLDDMEFIHEDSDGC